MSKQKVQKKSEKQKKLSLLKSRWGTNMSSTGLKRIIASALSAIIMALPPVPALSGLVAVLKLIAGAFGGIGLLHAAVAQTLSLNIPATFASLFATLAAVAKVYPVLQPFEAIFQDLASLIGSYTLGARLAKS